ncbi:hypothetical protein ACEPAH_9234 [Sanghuangporus vaninii]
MPISFLAVVGTPNAFGKVFHFRLYLVSRLPGAREVSVRIDMRPLLTGSRPMDGIAVIKYSLDRYIFTDSVQGCRHWCASVLERLAQEQLIPVGIPHEFADYEVEEHRRFGSIFPLPRIMGTFYQ